MSGRRLTLDEIATAKHLAAEGWTAYRIAKLFGRCESVIQRMLQDGGKANQDAQEAWNQFYQGLDRGKTCNKQS